MDTAALEIHMRRMTIVAVFILMLTPPPAYPALFAPTVPVASFPKRFWGFPSKIVKNGNSAQRSVLYKVNLIKNNVSRYGNSILNVTQRKTISSIIYAQDMIDSFALAARRNAGGAAVVVGAGILSLLAARSIYYNANKQLFEVEKQVNIGGGTNYLNITPDLFPAISIVPSGTVLPYSISIGPNRIAASSNLLGAFIAALALKSNAFTQKNDGRYEKFGIKNVNIIAPDQIALDVDFVFNDGSIATEHVNLTPGFYRSNYYATGPFAISVNPTIYPANGVQLDCPNFSVPADYSSVYSSGGIKYYGGTCYDINPALNVAYLGSVNAVRTVRETITDAQAAQELANAVDALPDGAVLPDESDIDPNKNPLEVITPSTNEDKKIINVLDYPQSVTLDKTQPDGTTKQLQMDLAASEDGTTLKSSPPYDPVTGTVDGSAISDLATVDANVLRSSISGIIDAFRIRISNHPLFSQLSSFSNAFSFNAVACTNPEIDLTSMDLFGNKAYQIPVCDLLSNSTLTNMLGYLAYVIAAVIALKIVLSA